MKLFSHEKNIPSKFHETFFQEKTFRQSFMKFHGFMKFGFDRDAPSNIVGSCVDTFFQDTRQTAM
jgi:hypothetical protein